MFSSIPYLRSPDLGFSFQDKAAHLGEFGVFGFLLQRSFHHLLGSRFRVYLLTFAVGAAYAGLDEVHQSFIDGREADVGDFVADVMGIVLFQALFWVVGRIEFFGSKKHFFVDF